MISVKQIYTGFLCLVVITLLIFSIPLTGQVNKITITGTVEGLEFDDNDNVLEVGIVVPQETDEVFEYINYTVIKKGEGLKLLELVGEMVEATGNLTVDADGNNSIEILKFKVVTPPDTEEEMPDIDDDIEQ
jgi:hypothetical protein